MRIKKGFTLLELIVVVIIVGILAAVAMPMMQNMKAKAIATEAVMGASAMRQVIRNYSIQIPEPGDMFIYIEGYAYLPTSLNINWSDFDSFEGTYFSKECYYGRRTSGEETSKLYGLCYFGSNTSTKVDEIKAMTDDGSSNASITVYGDGRITQSNFRRSGYPIE